MSHNSSIRVQKHRTSLRASGLRPIQIWVPVTRKKGFIKECHRQSRLLKKDVLENDTLKWIDSISDYEDWS